MGNNNITTSQTDELKEELMEEFFSTLVTSIQNKLSEGTEEEVNVFVNRELIATFHPAIVPDDVLVN